MEEFALQISELSGVSEEVAKNLFAAGFTTIDSFRGVTKEDLKAIDKIGDVMAERIVSSVQNFFLKKENEKLKLHNVELSALAGSAMHKKCFGNFDLEKRVCRVCSLQFDCEKK